MILELMMVLRVLHPMLSGDILLKRDQHRILIHGETQGGSLGAMGSGTLRWPSLHVLNANWQDAGLDGEYYRGPVEGRKTAAKLR